MEATFERARIRSTAWFDFLYLVSRLQVRRLNQIHTITDYYLFAFCTWILTTSTPGQGE
jgi:hypothetical protein